jgi:hypothetical protein
MIPETEAYYQKYSAWYESAGAARQDEFVFMVYQSAGFKPPSENQLEDEVRIKALELQDQDELSIRLSWREKSAHFWRETSPKDPACSLNTLVILRT